MFPLDAAIGRCQLVSAQIRLFADSPGDWTPVTPRTPSKNVLSLSHE
jgi:hypothetical protein